MTRQNIMRVYVLSQIVYRCEEYSTGPRRSLSQSQSTNLFDFSLLASVFDKRKIITYHLKNQFGRRAHLYCSAINLSLANDAI